MMEETVTCRICGHVGKSIQAHINHKHKMINKEYLSLYPDAKIYSDVVLKKIMDSVNSRDPSYKEKLSKMGKERWSNPEYRETQSSALKVAQNTEKAKSNHKRGAHRYYQTRTEEQRDEHVKKLVVSWEKTRKYRCKKLKEAHNREDSIKNHSQASRSFFEVMSDKEKEIRRDKIKKRWRDPVIGVKLKEVSKRNIQLANTEEARRKREIANKTIESKIKRKAAAVARLSRMPIKSSLNGRFKVALNNAGLFPEEEYPIGFYTVDFCFPDNRIVIEVDGDYWHGNPVIYPIPKNSQQRRSIGKDKAEKTFLTNRGWMLVRFWEKDINEDIDSCIRKVSEAVNEHSH